MTAREELRWRKASRSGNSGANCVELAEVLGGRAVRDSKNIPGPVLAFGIVAFDDLLSAVKVGQFER